MSAAYSPYKRSFFDRLFRLTERRSRVETIAQAELARLLMGGETSSGLPVDRVTAMGVAAVNCAIRLLSETIASLPVHYYERIERGKEKADSDPLYDLMHRAPNKEQTAFQFIETMTYHAALLGNAYAHKVESKGGYVMELNQLDTERMDVERRDGKKIYRYRLPVGERIYQVDEILHLAGLGYDGMKGHNQLAQVRNVIGFAQALDRFGAEFFANFSTPGGHIELPGHLKDEAAMMRFKASWGDAHRDWGKKHSVGVLEGGAKWVGDSIPPNHAQFIETRQFVIGEVARIFRVPPHLIGDLSRATFSNIEQQSIDFVVNTIRPWLVRWEQALNFSLIPDSQKRDHFFEFLVDALLRGDIVSRSQAYRTFIEIGMMSPNEGREKENWNPIPDGDKHFVPMNWVPIDQPFEPRVPAMDDSADQFNEDSEDSGERMKRQRATRAASARWTLSESYKRLFEDVAGKIVRKEVRDIRNLMNEHLRKRGQSDFELLIDEYYKAMPEYIRRQIMPTYQSYMELIKRELAQEMGIKDTLSPEDTDFLRSFITVFTERYIGESRSDIRKALARAAQEAIDVSDALDETLDHWSDVRARSVAQNETVQSGNAFAKNMYILAGVTVLRWVAMGVDPCPLCRALNGTVVGVNEMFVHPGDIVTGGNKELQSKRRYGHPPLHNGCVCQITAG